MAHKIYTRTGDAGETGLRGGDRVPKDSLRVEVYGTLDELNAHLGLARAAGAAPQMDAVLGQIQDDLFRLGADLADPRGNAVDSPGGLIGPSHQALLEETIDQYEARLPPLSTFILPGGTPLAAHLHVARAVCRRAERRCVTLARAEAIPPHTVSYLNRLSDLLFVLARAANHGAGRQDIPWRPTPQPADREADAP